MNRQEFINIKQIKPENLHEMYYFCFTYTIQPNLRITYTTNKGTTSKRKYSTVPFRAQKDFLLKGIDTLNDVAYFFEQNKDNRYHIHGFCHDTAHNVLQYMKCRYEDTQMKDKTDLHDYCLLVEKVLYKPSWVTYCQKEQQSKDVFSKEIFDFLNNVKTEYIKIEQNTFEQQEPDYSKYLFGKKFLIEI